MKEHRPNCHIICSLSLLLVASLSPDVSPAVQRQKPAQKRPTQATKEKVLQNADIIRMVKDGFEERVILGAMRANPTKFDLSVDGLMQLKGAGVSQNLINAMLETASPGAPPATAARAGVTSPPPSPPQPAPTPVANTARPTAPDVAQATDDLMRAVQAQGYQGLNLTATVNFMRGGSKVFLYSTASRIGQANADGTGIGELAKEEAVQDVFTMAASTATIKATESVMMSTGSMGMGGMVLGAGMQAAQLGRKLFGRKPKPVTYVWAIPGYSANTSMTSNAPSFEVEFSNIPDLDPDEFEPHIIKLVSTRNNWRIHGALKAKPGTFMNEKKNLAIYDGYISDVVPSQSTKLGRGRYSITPSAPLIPGEYGVVIRPISKTRKYSGSEIFGGCGGRFCDNVWSFVIPGN